MTAQQYKIDFKGTSPFQVFDASGNVMFDARHAALRPVQSAIVNLPQYAAINTDMTNVYADIMLARPRPGGAPIYVGCAFAGGMYGSLVRKLVLPSMSFFSQFVYGWFISSFSDRVRIYNQSKTLQQGNLIFPGDITGYCVIMDNSVSG